MRKIRIAQIGISAYSHGLQVFKSIEKQNQLFEIVGYSLPENECEKFPFQAKFLEKYREITVEEILEDKSIEAVAIETEEIYLTKYALMAAKSGKHIHMEKPGGIVFADFEKLISAMKNTGKVFHIGYMYRYNPYIKELIQSVKEGKLGQIISVEAQMNCYHTTEMRKQLANFPGGMTFFLGCHLIDLIYTIQGTPKNIIPFNKCSGVDGVTSEDFGMAVFEYENGVSFAKASAIEIGGFERRQLVVTGTKASVELKPLEWYLDGDNLVTERYVRKNTDWHSFTVKETSDTIDRYDDMMSSFADMVRGKKENKYSYDYEIELYKVLLTACGIRFDNA